MKLGQRFVDTGLVSEEQILEALALQDRSGGQIGDILLAMSNIRALDFYLILAHHYGLEFVDLLKNPPDLHLLTETDHDIYFTKKCIPIRCEGDKVTIATWSPSLETINFIKSYWGQKATIICTSRFDVLWILQQRFSDHYLDEAINKLINSNIAFSAKKTFNIWQKFLLIGLVSITIFYAVTNPIGLLILINILLTITLSGTLIYKIFLAIIALFLKTEYDIPKLEKLSEKNFPIYTILIPLYDEKYAVLKQLFENISKIDYPKHKLDIKILLESDDVATIAAIKSLNLPNYFVFIYVPSGVPRTKAKACNYGLKFARGEYLTLYDAEDKPDPYQLKIALATFLENPDSNLGCLQSRLNFYNSNENWLTRMFTIEYTYWFDMLLPALEYLGTPIPLGGTSNHFNVAVLRDIDAWDPYNVAEDADLGVRLQRLGYQTRVIPTTTYEEANCQLINWIKQRTRWIKGYMQTYIVHMRNPYKLWRALGTRGFIGFQLFIGGTILSNLSNLLLWVIFFFLLMPSPYSLGYLFPKSIIFLAWCNFIIGTLGIIFLNLLGILRRQKYEFFLVAFTAPAYWLLMSVASYRALYQLFFNPSYWDKTQHGISKIYDTSEK